jgi:hypothetical protein
VDTECNMKKLKSDLEKVPDIPKQFDVSLIH